MQRTWTNDLYRRCLIRSRPSRNYSGCNTHRLLPELVWSAGWIDVNHHSIDIIVRTRGYVSSRLRSLTVRDTQHCHELESPRERTYPEAVAIHASACSPWIPMRSLSIPHDLPMNEENRKFLVGLASNETQMNLLGSEPTVVSSMPFEWRLGQLGLHRKNRHIQCLPTKA